MKPTTLEEVLLAKYRRIMDCIHGNGNIYQDKGRKAAYDMLALMASNLRKHGLPPCGCKVSTGICGCLTYGMGRLDNNGFWEIACPHGQEIHICWR